MNDTDTDTKAFCEELQRIWYQQIPLSKAMQMQIVNFDGEMLTTAASLAPNVNVHGTAFAGSLYAIQALTGWGMMHLQLKLNALDASIVIASGQIDYAKPVAEEIIVRCSFGEHAAEMEKLKIASASIPSAAIASASNPPASNPKPSSTMKARFPLSCEVLLTDGTQAGQFSGLYAVRLNR